MTDEASSTAQRQGRHQEHRQYHGEQHQDHDERFPRERRLRSAADFAAVRQRGRRVSSAHLMLSYARRQDGDVATGALTRVGLSVSKRVGDAVRRNLVKRRLREQVRRFLWNVAPAWDMIITAKSGAAEVDFATLGAEALDIVTRAHLFMDDARR